MYWKKYSLTQHLNKIKMIKEMKKTFELLNKNKISIKNIRKKPKNKVKYLNKISNIITDKNIFYNNYYTYQIM